MMTGRLALESLAKNACLFSAKSLRDAGDSPKY